MKKIVLSAIGKDRPGIVAGVTHNLFAAGCNLEDSAMTILEGEFALLVIASRPSKISMKVFQDRLQTLAKKLGLVLNIKEMEVSRSTSVKNPRSAIITASGTDRTGILYKISNVLAKYKVNITDLSSRQIPSPGNKTLYVVMIETALPKTLALEKLRKHLKRVATSMRLDVTVREIAVEKL